jgi:hypothetical protein
VGNYGAQFKIFPGGGNALTGLTNNYTDVAEDFQVQFIGEKNTATIKGTYVRENQSLNASGPLGLGTSNASDWVSYLSTDFTYWYKRKYGLTAGYISTHGSTDKLLYNGGCVTVPVTACSSGGTIYEPNQCLAPRGRRQQCQR